MPVLLGDRRLEPDGVALAAVAVEIGHDPLGHEHRPDEVADDDITAVMAIAGKDNFVTNTTNFIFLLLYLLFLLLYLLIPWTAINLVDFYLVKHGRTTSPPSSSPTAASTAASTSQRARCT